MMGTSTRRKRGKRIAAHCWEFGGKARIDAGPPRKTATMTRNVMALGGTIYAKRGAAIPTNLPAWPVALIDSLGQPITGKGQKINYLDRTAEPVWYVYSLGGDGRWAPVEVHDARELAEQAALNLAKEA